MYNANSLVENRLIIIFSVLLKLITLLIPPFCALEMQPMICGGDAFIKNKNKTKNEKFLETFSSSTMVCPQSKKKEDKTKTNSKI